MLLLVGCNSGEGAFVGRHHAKRVTTVFPLAIICLDF